MAENRSRGPLIQRVEAKMQAAFAPHHLEVINESHLHAGHQPGFDGKGESHIRIRIQSSAFDEMNRVAIHRAINAELAEELDAGLHALAIDARGMK